MIDINDALKLQKILNIKFDKFTIEDLLIGFNVEYGTISPITNITNDDLITTSKIALAHLNEFPNYYNDIYGIKVFEEYLKYKM